MENFWILVLEQASGGGLSPCEWLWDVEQRSESVCLFLGARQHCPDFVFKGSGALLGEWISADLNVGGLALIVLFRCCCRL